MNRKKLEMTQRLGEGSPALLARISFCRIDRAYFCY